MNAEEARLKAFGQRLKAYLDEAGLPQKDLTECVDLTEGPISKIVSGTYPSLTQERAKRIVKCDLFLDVGVVETVEEAEAWLRLANPAWGFSAAERAELRQKLQADIYDLVEFDEPVGTAALDHYHRCVRQDHASIELYGVYKEHRRPVTLPLDQVFVSLRLTGGERDEKRPGGPGLGQAPPDPQPFNRALPETVRAGKHLVIVGGAGSGKTTFLSYAAHALAKSHVEADPALAEARIGLSGYIPIFLRLRDVFPNLDQPAGGDRRTVSPDELIGTMAKTFQRDHPASRLDADFFDTVVKNQRHRCLILLDGLDEVVTPPEAGADPSTRRELVTEAIRKLDHPEWNNRLVVTSRPDAYRGQAVLGEPCLRWDVQPVTREQRAELVEKWCAEVYREAAEDQVAGLLRGLNDMAQRDERLVETPLLITVMALVWHEREGQFPERRWQIFQAGLEALLDVRKARDAGGRDLEAAQMRMEGPLRRMAFRMLWHGDALAAKEQILAWLKPETSARREELSQGLEVLGDRGGLLVRSWDRYEFGIRLFQEYLAAREMEAQWHTTGDDEQRLALLRPIYRDPNWLEVFRLCAERLGATYSGVQFARCLRRLAAPRQRAVGLVPPAPLSPEAGEAEARALYLSGLALWEAWPWKGEEAGERTWAELGAEKEALIRHIGEMVRRDPPTALARSRFEATGMVGQFLGINARERADFAAELFADFVRVAGGPCLMGTSDAEVQWLLEHEPDWAPYWQEQGYFAWEQPQHEVDVPEFLVARFPVTFAQFELFVTGDGYENGDYWTEAGWEWVRHPVEVVDWSRETGYVTEKVEGPIRSPRWWPSDWANRPVVGVSWYEAYAYCNWLDQQLRETDPETLPDALREVILEKGWVIRLPTEAEWEKAASWDPKAQYKRRYPWGDAWDPDRCNSEASQLGEVSPVGIYPHGAAPCGAEEVAGNVWEWCHTRWGDDEWVPQFGYPYRQDEREDPEGDTLRVVRGGAFYNDRRYVRCASRSRGFPDSRGYLLGCRVVVAPVRL